MRWMNDFVRSLTSISRQQVQYLKYIQLLVVNYNPVNPLTFYILIVHDVSSDQNDSQKTYACGMLSISECFTQYLLKEWRWKDVCVHMQRFVQVLFHVTSQRRFWWVESRQTSVFCPPGSTCARSSKWGLNIRSKKFCICRNLSLSLFPKHCSIATLHIALMLYYV